MTTRIIFENSTFYGVTNIIENVFHRAKIKWLLLLSFEMGRAQHLRITYYATTIVLLF